MLFPYTNVLGNLSNLVQFDTVPRITPLNILRQKGYLYKDGLLDNATYGNWTRSIRELMRPYSFYYSAAYFHPQSSSDCGNGLSIRCLARQNPIHKIPSTFLYHFPPTSVTMSLYNIRGNTMAKKADKTDGQVEQMDGKSEALKLAISQITKQFGDGSIMKLGETKKIDVELLPSGSLSLDLALGGGYPKGRIIEIFGPESSGKTTLALHAIAEIQKQGGQAAFIDAEHALDPAYARKIGVNTNDLLISQPDNGEQALEICETLVRSGAVDLIIVDSVAALVPQAEIDGDMGDAQMGLQARLMSQAMRKLTGIISKSKATVIFINQIRMKIGVMFGNPETTTGGNALKFYASVRIDIRRIGQIKDGDNVSGNRTKVKIVKNKIAAPFRTAEFDVMYNEGISKVGDVLDLAVQYNVIEKAGAFLKYNGETIGQGREAVKRILKERPEFLAEIEGKVRELAKASEDID